MTPLNIDFIAPPLADSIFEPMAASLSAQGHQIGRFRTTRDFLAAPDALVRTNIIMALQNPISREILSAPELRAVAAPGIGTEHIDEATATELGVLVVNGQIEQNFISMAESAFLFILASLYDLDGAQRMLRQNAGPRRARMLMNKTVGLIGFGRIAQALAERLSTWQVRLLASVRTPRALPPYVQAAPLETLLRNSDIVVVLTPITDETRGMLSPQRLALMKNDVVFVNIARGGIADDDAVAALAQERTQMRLALDVFEPEPLRADSPLRDLPNAILTPHAIGNTEELFRDLPAALLANLERIAEGQKPSYVRNPQILDQWVARWGNSAA